MKKLLVVFIFSILSLFIFVPNSYAKVMVQEKGTAIVSAKEVINDDLFIGAENAEIHGTVNGNVFVGAGTVTIDGVINGDLLVGSGNVSLSGKVKNNVFIGAGDVTISKASIGDSLLVGSGNLRIDEASTIKGSLITGVGMLVNNAKVGRNLFVGAGTASLNSSIGGEARIGAGEIKIGENTKVAKDLYYAFGENGKSDLVLPKGATVSGSIYKIAPNEKTVTDVEKAKTEFMGASKMVGNGLLLVAFLGALVVGLLVVKLSSKCNCVDSVTAQVSNSPLSNFWVGLLILILTIPLAILTMLTIVGAPLAVMVLALYGVAVYLARLAVSLALGKWISTKFNWTKMNVYTNLLLGLVIFFVLKSIPVVGGLTTLIFTTIGLGAFYKLVKNR